MNSIFCAAANTANVRTQMLWLPGAYHQARQFVEAGFASAVLHRDLPLDLVFVDLELQHLGDRTVLAQLREQFVLPALEAGMALWLGGISLGGLFALHYAHAYPGDLSGVCLLAPYLGNRMLTSEIAMASGLAAWEPGTLAETDDERQIWRYIKSRTVDSSPLYLGYGRQDRFAEAHHLLATSLPAGAVNVIEGGHDWPTWSRLWENFLDQRWL